jgi:hypothetical protein
MERTLISWNLPNWITVMIMAAAGYAVLAAVSQAVKSRPAVGAGGGY